MISMLPPFSNVLSFRSSSFSAKSFARPLKMAAEAMSSVASCTASSVIISRSSMAAAINNYVRMKLMPAPEKKKYNRIHIAYLIMICALKQSLTMSEIQKILPNGLTEDEVKKTYEAFVGQYTDSARVFVSMVESMAAQLLAAESADAADVNSFVLSTAVMTNFSRLLTTKLLDLQNAPFTEEAVALWNPEE